MEKQKSILVGAMFPQRIWLLYFRTIEERKIMLNRLKQRYDFTIISDEVIKNRCVYLKKQVLTIPQFFKCEFPIYKMYPYSIVIKSHRNNLQIQKMINHLIKDIDDDIQILTRQHTVLLPCKEINLI